MLLSSVLAISILTTAAMPAFAQVPVPQGPKDCKANEHWDEATKRCAVK